MRQIDASDYSSTSDLEPNVQPLNHKKTLKEKIQDFQRKIKELPLIPQVLVVSIPFIIVLGGMAHMSYRIIFDIPASDNLNIQSPRALVNEDGEVIDLDEISNPKTAENPLNGVLMSPEEYENMIKYPPVASVFGNTIDAREPSGLYQADLAFEMLVEGDITRIVGMFWTYQPEKLGSLRSARKPFIDILTPYDPLFMHIGYAHSTNSVETDAQKALSDNHIKTVGGSASFWRTKDRIAPHNAYTSVANIHEAADKMKYTYTKEIIPWKFKSDATEEERGDVSQIMVSFMGSYREGRSYDVRWEYDPGTNSYKRFYGSKPHSDNETNQQIVAKNVIIQYTEVYHPAADNYGRKAITIIGSGEGLLFQDGKQIEITWEQSSATSRNVYKIKETGAEVEFNRGMIWVMITQKGQGEVIVK
ncbi:MAG TPA: DUF3048 domain-containing protein [Candidatus Dojkabacteria bacterium]|nr:DUF3048 domain-containing protein [Candidatus Dojkabacteria bacterium]HQF37233.1 DUF3048 domain-containing protein [Candidatus Dojkabacteria bacterium]